MTAANVAALCAMGIGFCSLMVIFSRLCERNLVVSPAVEEEDEASKEREESRRKRKESILNILTVKEWSLDDPPFEATEECLPDDLPFEPTEGEHDTPPPSEEAVEGPQPPAPRPTDSSPTACAMGSDDCESVAGEEEEDMAGCAICLSHFKPQQLVCESNNISCQHVFHQTCMVDWLTKDRDDCPMCREIYILKTV
jgi:hypothetical protein